MGKRSDFPEESLFIKESAMYVLYSVIKNLDCPLEIMFTDVQYALEQGSPTPGPWTRTGLWDAYQELSGEPVSETSSVFAVAPKC